MLLSKWQGEGIYPAVLRDPHHSGGEYISWLRRTNSKGEEDCQVPKQPLSMRKIFQGYLLAPAKSVLQRAPLHRLCRFADQDLEYWPPRKRQTSMPGVWRTEHQGYVPSTVRSLEGMPPLRPQVVHTGDGRSIERRSRVAPVSRLP